MNLVSCALKSSPAWVLRSASAQAECLCASRNTGVGPGLVTDVDGLENVTECEG